MCRNIKILFNFDPPATDEETHATAIQSVRKVSGSSRANKPAFDAAIDDIAESVQTLLNSFSSNAPPKNCEEERLKAQVHMTNKQFGTPLASATNQDSGD